MFILENFDIKKNEIIYMKFSYDYLKYKIFMESKLGKRKVYIPLTFRYHDKEFTIEINKRANHKEILNQILEHIYDKYYHVYYERTYRDGFEYTYSDEINLDFNEIYDFKLNEYGTIIIKTVDDGRKQKRQEVIDAFKDYITFDRMYNEYKDSIKPDFSNYLTKKESKFNNEGAIDKYFELIEKYADVLKLDKITSGKVNYIDCSSYASIPYNINNNPKKDMLKEFKYLLKRESDIIALTPNIKDWTVDNFFRVNIMNFEAMYNENALKVYKHLSESRSKHISRYYESKTSGEYVGD